MLTNNSPYNFLFLHFLHIFACRNTVEDIQKMPLVYIRPVNKRSDNLVYDCPVYTDKVILMHGTILLGALKLFMEARLYLLLFF